MIVQVEASPQAGFQPVDSNTKGQSAGRPDAELRQRKPAPARYDIVF